MERLGFAALLLVLAWLLLGAAHGSVSIANQTEESTCATSQSCP